MITINFDPVEESDFAPLPQCPICDQHRDDVQTVSFSQCGDRIVFCRGCQGEDNVDHKCDA